MAAHANSTHSYLDRNYFNDALTLLDDTRDAEELEMCIRDRSSRIPYSVLASVDKFWNRGS